MARLQTTMKHYSLYGIVPCALAAAVLTSAIVPVQAAPKEDMMMEFRLLDEGDHYLRTGDELKLQFADTYYKDVPVHYDITWYSRTGALEIDDQGVLHAKKPGKYEIGYSLAYSKETLEQLEEKYPDVEWILPDLAHYMNFTVSDNPYVFRLYNPNSGEHFYTADKKEWQSLVTLGWTSEGYGWLGMEQSDQPVYRLYDANAGDHHFTMDQHEYDVLGELGWTKEGIAWYAAGDTQTPVYRQYNPNAKAGRHNLTTSENERKHLTSIGWKDEGIAWYTPVIEYSDSHEPLPPESQN